MARERKIREDYLEMLAGIEGIYVPSFYDVEFNEDNTIKSFNPNRDCAPKQVKKRIIKDLDNTYIPEKLIVPFMETVHDRIMLSFSADVFAVADSVRQDISTGLCVSARWTSC